MWPATVALAAALAGPASALLVASGSPCSQYCGNTLSNTTGSDMTCSDDSYGSSAGIVFENCIGCELTSNYSTVVDNTNQTDLQWLLYNLRYTLSYCVFGDPDNSDWTDNPCITEYACGNLESAIEWDNLTQDTGSYDFCQNWVEDDVSRCGDCLTANDDMSYLRNYVTILDAACSQLPSVGATLSIDGSPFSSVAVNITTATPSSSYSFGHSGPLSLGGEVGIAVGGFVFLLMMAGVGVICVGRRRRRAYLKSIAARYATTQPGWPSAGPGYPSRDMFETPMSQKPLRGWDNSPVSMATDRFENNGSYPRYFSPYSSQYNSPVSAVDGKTPAWPTAAPVSGAVVVDGSGTGVVGDVGEGSSKSSHNTWAAPTQEETERAVHEQDHHAHIGVALGGTDPSLHSKNSNVGAGAPREAEGVPGASPPPPAGFQQTTVFGTSPSAGTVLDRQKGKGRDESYELNEIDSNGVSPVSPVQTGQAPVLQHPGYGRGVYYPRPPSPLAYGDLTEEDARQGHAM